MMGVTLLVVVLIFLSVGLNMQTAESCRCLPPHPQQQFCTSEIVILADATGKRLPVKDQNDLFRYKIKIIKVLNGSNNAKRIQYIYTDPQAMCGITLDEGRYVLSGYLFKDGIRSMMCGLVERWDHLSLTEQENFKETYKTGCNCTISTCSASPCCPQSKKECMWNDSLQSREHVCLKDSEGICSWYRPSSKVDEDAMCKQRRG